ncbi:hypothetical protein FS827_27695 [Agrobacterium vitis]|uniref:hypothetical protein n=1 Tax=Rhizobium/Agrobacterium group TaxID=227290 RepID=UPI0012E842AD|nr:MULTISPECIES: hypothetical protein [Rhizobium/Agrobacterium group]MCF1465038.1 hypothetical protein [Allorhizobium ampelinum]MCF1494002.1 hypothetical protein [Allorhizobium ampelinum]MVA46661.1 hypothetical protein [Agrobacterium vitis]
MGNGICLRSGRFVCLLLGLLFCTHAHAQMSTIPERCWLFSELDEEASVQVDKLLLEIDGFGSTTDMISAHMELMKQAQGALNFCEIETRLRKLGGKTYLLAMPYQYVTGLKAARNYSLTYVNPIFQTTSPIPKFTIWYEREGPSRAKQLLSMVGFDAEQNISNLNSTGMLVNASSQHPLYKITSDKDQESDPGKYKKQFDNLKQYEADGLLSYKYSPMLMHVIDQYMPFMKEKNYSINTPPTPDAISFFVIKEDPGRLLIGRRCGCYYLPTTTILCDEQLLAALQQWVKYGSGDDAQLSYIVLMNNAIGDLLLHWVIGHEMAHKKYEDNYGAMFSSDDEERPVLPADNAPKKPPRDMESRADTFAYEHLPPAIAGWSHMATNFIIQQLVGIANPQALGDKSSPIVVNETPYDHPNLLTRAYSLKNVTGAVDFLLEEYEARTVTDNQKGTKYYGICSLVQ